MKIALYTAGAYSAPDFVEAVSGHVQPPLVTAKMLMEAGHDVTLITTRPQSGYVLPATAPAELRVVHVTNASKYWPKQGTYVTKAIHQVCELRWHCARGRYDLVHFFGFSRTALLAGLLKRLAPRKPVLATVYSPFRPAQPVVSDLQRAVVRPINRLLTQTSYAQNAIAKWSNKEVVNVRTGVANRMGAARGVRPPTGDKVKRVLFWRNADYDSGADICIEAFKDLSDRYRHTDFLFAVRPHDVLEQQLLEFASLRENVHLHIFPYEEGITLEGLIRSTTCCVFPFRKLSINPQTAVLETLAAGCPAIVSDVESNSEIVRNGETGLVLPRNNANHLVAAVERLLAEPDRARRMGEMAARCVAESWNWEVYRRRLTAVYNSCVA